MTDQEVVQLSDNAAQVYQRDFVPVMFEQWPPQLCDAAEIATGDRVLDVGCGTGVFAREAAVRAGDAGNITGLDLNESMLAVARSITPEIEWRVGDVMGLPFPDDDYNVVASQFVLMFVPDRVAAVREMWRVLAPGGRLVLSVWSDSPAYSALADIAHRLGAEQVATSVEVPFDLGDKSKILSLFHESGISDVGVQTRDGWVRFASIDEFVRVEIKGWILADSLDEASYEALLAEARDRLADLCESDGQIVFPMNAHIITARKPRRVK